MSLKELVSQTGKSLPKRDAISVVVVGDAGVGKTSLISSLVSESFSAQIPAVLQPVIVPADLTREKIPFAIIDTAAPTPSAAAGGAATLSDDTTHQLKSADAIVLVVSASATSTPATIDTASPSIDRIASYWLPLLQSIAVSAPVVVAINKSDLSLGATHPGVAVCKALSDSLRIESYVDCSARNMTFVSHVFYSAQRAVLNPMRALINSHTQRLQPAFVKALQRIFRLWEDSTRGDGAATASPAAAASIGDTQIDAFQTFCFCRRLQSTDITDLKSLLTKRSADAVDSKSGRLTFAGFCLLFQLFIEQRRTDAAWIVLDKYGYGFDLKIRSDYIALPSALAATTTVASSASASKTAASAAAAAAAAAIAAADDIGNCEFSAPALEWLTNCFNRFAARNTTAGGGGDGISSSPPAAASVSIGSAKAADEKVAIPAGSVVVAAGSLADIFGPCPVHPFTAESFPYFSSTASGAMDVRGWLSHWSSLLLFNPISTLYQLCYCGAPKSVLDNAIVVHPRKSVERTASTIERRTVYALVFGSSGSGKTTLMRRLVQKPVQTPTSGGGSGDHVITRRIRTYANVLDHAMAGELKSPATDAKSAPAAVPTDRILIATEVPADARSVDSILDDSQPLLKCDVVCVVFESGVGASLSYAIDIVKRIPYHIPCVLLQSKTDRNAPQTADQLKAITEYEIAVTDASLIDASPLAVSATLNYVFDAALSPGSFRPVSLAERSRRQTRNYAIAGGVFAAVAIGIFALRTKGVKLF